MREFNLDRIQMLWNMLGCWSLREYPLSIHFSLPLHDSPFCSRHVPIDTVTPLHNSIANHPGRDRELMVDFPNDNNDADLCRPI